MVTTIASGLGATWGIAQEVTPGTWVTPARWLPMMTDKVVGAKKTVQSSSLHGGLTELGTRRRLVLHEAKGAVDLDLTDKQLGLLFRHMIGSTASAVQVGSTAAWVQNHTPGDTTGLSLSLQSGRPEISGTVVPFSYNGAKITAWDISVATDGLAKLSVTFDAVDESISQTYGAPSYIKSNVLSFVDATLLLGGTVTTTSGVVSVSGGAAPIGTVSAANVAGTNGLDIARQNIGSLTKREQLVNAFRKYNGSISVEFANTSDMYAAYYADTPMALQLNFQGGLIAGSSYAGLVVTIPQVYLDGTPPATDGPAILKVQVPYVVLDDQTNPVIQLAYTSTDVTV